MNYVDTFKCSRLKKTFTVGRCVRNQKDALDFWGPEASKFQSCPCDQGIKIRQQMEGGVMAAKKKCRNCERVMAISQDGLCGGCFNRGKGLEGQERLEALAQAKEDFEGKPPLVCKVGQGVRLGGVAVAGQRGHGNRQPRGKAAGKSPRKAKVEEQPKTDPASGAIDEEMPPGIIQKVEEQPKTDPTNGALAIAARCRDRAADAAKQEPDWTAIMKRADLAFTAAPEEAVHAAISIVVNFTDGDHALFEGLQALAKKNRRNPDQHLLWLLEREMAIEQRYLTNRSGAAHGIDAKAT
jgi:hypothetical protein